MAFSFGASQAAPATPAFGSTPAPAAPSFGSTATAPTPAAPAFGSTPAPVAPSLGATASTPAPATGGLFGNTPAPAPSGGLFGSTPAPAPAGGLFGSTPAAPAPSSGFSFGGTTTSPAPAPSGSLFGSTPAPAPSGSLFGSTPATTSGFASTPSMFSSQPAAAQPAAAPVMIITSTTPYSALPPEARRAIDTIHQEIMRHKKIMNNVETMAPALLREPLKPADAAAGGGSTSNLHQQCLELQHSLEGLQGTITKYRQRAIALQGQMEASTTQSIMYGMWPVEAVAVRRGVKLSSNQQLTDPSVRAQLQKLLDQQVAHVDRVERIPSPYMWQTLEELERRAGMLMQQLLTLNRELDANASDEVMDVASIVHSQTEAIARVAHDVTRMHEHMEQLRSMYRQTERGENILDKADVAEYERQRRLEQQAKQQFMKASSAAQQAPAAAPSTSAPAPATGGLFGSTPAPAPAGGLFGSTPAAAPAPTGGLFGSNPAPAPATTAPAPSGGLFGSTPAPAPGAAAPAPSGGLFGSTPAPATGTTPAPAPVGTGAPPAPSLFGSTPAPATNAPAPAFSFTGAPATTPGATNSTSSTPRSKGGSRSRNRGRR